MLTAILAGAAAAWFGGGFAQLHASTARGQSLPDPDLLQRYCVTCHNERSRTAGLVLDGRDLTTVGAEAQVWEQVVRQLRSGVMPPPGAPRPPARAAEAFVSALEAELDRASAASRDPGRPPIHRLNRTEYANAVRDLLDLDFDTTELFPADPSLGGFDNVAGVLSVSPVLLERYLTAAERISRLAVGDPTIGPAFASRTYDVGKQVYQDDRMSEDLPFGSRGGLAVRHHFPLDGEYLWTVRLRRNIFGYVRGLRDAHGLELRLDGERVGAFTVGGDAPGEPAPESFAGLALGDPDWEAYTLAADDGLQVRVPVGAGTRRVGVSFFEALVEEEGVLQPPLTGLGLGFSELRSSPAGPPGPAVDSISIDGPFDPTGPGTTPSRARVFVCRPERTADDEPCAATILSGLARRAYRRPVDAADVDVLLGFFREGRRTGGFEAGIGAALERLLVDPSFLFRIERDPDGVAPGAVYRLDGVALASRLAFFLWSSIPDDALLDAAIGGRLQDDEALEAEVRRMLADDRAAALVRGFASQWLTLQRLRDVSPDPELFSDFDDTLRAALRRETELFVESQLRADRSVRDLLAADYTFVNERLARHYGIPNVYGSRFRRVSSGDGRRGGLLGQGSILTLTSYPTRTSPVQRGRWLLENILGTPPPPPPPDTPTTLAERDGAGAPLSTRERMERHRSSPACAACHARMDPLGFALEPYDAIGRWRVRDESGRVIDASGRFPDGAEFEGPAGLRRLLDERSAEFVRTVAEKMLTYAVGRPLTHADMPAVREIVRQAAPDDYRWSSLVLAVVRSVPFQMRRAAS